MNKGYEYFEDLFQNVEKKGDVTIFKLSESKYLYLSKNNLIVSYIYGNQSKSRSYSLKEISGCYFSIDFNHIYFELRESEEHLFELDIENEIEYDYTHSDIERMKELTEKASALLFFMLENMKDNEVNY